MKIVDVLLALSLVATAEGQTGRRLMAGSASTRTGAFRYETRLEPATPVLAEKFGGGMIGGPSGMHRYMTVDDRQQYFGYDLLLEPLPETNTYRVTVSPLSMDAAGLRLKEAAAWSKVPLPGYPAPQVLRGGDSIVLDLLINVATGQKIVDYIHVLDKKRLVVAAAGQARDFAPEDAELHLMDPQVSVNGKLLESTVGGVAGAAIWFFLPERGRYFLSLAPHSRYGFQKAGEIRGNALSFRIGGEHIQIDCNGRIAPGNAPFTLYVLHQPGWRPKGEGGRDAFGFTAGDRIDLLLQN